MSAKQKIVAALGEDRLALPGLLDEALAANDRVKFRLTLLQLARRQADAPDGAAADLTLERRQARLDDATLDRLPATCTRDADGYRLPALHGLLAAAAEDVRTMLAPLTVGAPDAPATRALAARAERLLAPLRGFDERFTPADIHGWTHAERGDGDGLHLLVMDLHRELNALQAAIATEIVDGASTYGLEAADRECVRAFMRGVARTARLKFDHPGLGTTATRSGGRLVIQNDIGTTDAHVIVVHVTDREVTLTYTDVHLQRLLFLQDVVTRAGVEWQGTQLVQDRAMADGLYHVTVGRYAPVDRAALHDFLAHLGSRLVFLIDWNRARKQLRQLVGKKLALGLLRWAAAQDLGHMAFLRVGGASTVLAALDLAARGRGHFGQTLEDVLGTERAERFLQFALRSAATVLLEGRSEALVVDEIRAELARCMRSSAESAYDLAAEHVGLVAEIAAAVLESTGALDRRGESQPVARLAERCRRWETDADRVLNDMRDVTRLAPEVEWLRAFVACTDDVADALEDCAFLLTLLDGESGDAATRRALGTAARLVAHGVRELVRAVEILRSSGAGGTSEDMREFIETVHRIGRVEHETDAVRRDTVARLARSAASPREWYVVSEAAAKLERAADHLQHGALGLRDAVLDRRRGA